MWNSGVPLSTGGRSAGFVLFSLPRMYGYIRSARRFTWMRSAAEGGCRRQVARRSGGHWSTPNHSALPCRGHQTRKHEAPARAAASSRASRSAGPKPENGPAVVLLISSIIGVRPWWRQTRSATPLLPAALITHHPDSAICAATCRSRLIPLSWSPRVMCPLPFRADLPC